MSSAAVVIVLLAAVWVSSTVADIAPCSDEIIRGLSTHPQCYPNGQPPSQQSKGDQKTFIVLPEGMLPENVCCVTAIQGSTQAVVTLHYQDGVTQQQLIYDQTFTSEYIIETDPAGIKYRIYMFRNEKTVYAYYRCLDDSNGTGTQHAGHIAVGCLNVNDEESEKVVNTAKECFEMLNITSYVDIQPCNCGYGINEQETCL